MSEHGPYYRFVTATPGTVSVLFNPPRDAPKFSPQILMNRALQREPMEGMHVFLEGKSAVWIYAHAAYTAVRRGAARISVRLPQEPDPIVIYPLPTHIPGGAAGQQDDRWYEVQAEGEGHYELRFKDCGGGLWPVAVLGTHPVELPAGDVASLVLGGRGSVWMYAAVGVAAARRGIRTLLCDIPHEQDLLSIGEMTPGCCVPRKKIRSSPGLVVGIVGDPNTGKSVFAHLLKLVLRRQYPDSWIYDCDAASPTPNWYLTMLQSDRDAEGMALRTGQKRQWTDSLEQDMAASLRTLKTSLEVVLADLPGGNHSLPEPQRIPKGRETMLREVDLFMILGRIDKPDSIGRWREDLALHGLDGRIMAEFWTQEPDGELDWSISRQEGLVKGILTGLDRRKDPVAAVGALYTQAWEILRHLRSWSLAQIARAATSKAFLTKPGGVHYGASVLCADGVIYSAGQYASYNHSTNVHAEQGALVLATMAGRPDVLALALATSEPGAFARPCGVCRQIMLEHAMRIGHDFDVVMSSSSGILDIRTVTGLLPLAWPSHHASVVGSGDPCQGRAMIPTLDTSHRRWPVAVGDIVCHGDGNLLSLVWDPCLSKGLALVKIKYRREKGVWVKMPHSLTEPFQYERSLRDLGRSCPTGFGGFAAVVHSAEITGIGSSPTTLDILPPEFYRLLGEALIQPGSVRMTGSRAVGLSTEGSDHDVVISASPAQIRRFRAIALEGYRQGLLGVPIASGSWKWLGASFPGGQNEILRQGRFIETFEMGANRFAILFVPPDPQPMVVDETWRLDGRGAIHGIVIEADDAPYKRSVFQVRCPDGLMVEAIVFFKLGNLVFPGDHLALHGWMLTSLNRQSTRRLVLLSPSSDKIVWLETAPPSCGGGSLSLIRNGSK